MLGQIRLLRDTLKAFLRAKGGNIAMMFGLSLIPITIAAGAGVDLARAMAVKASMADALDAAGLAIGSTQGISQSTAQNLAQQYFTANFKPDSSADSVPAISVTITGQSVVISASDNMPTTVLKAAGQMLHTASLQNINITSSTTVVWGQTKLWVALVLDNTGSMTQTDATNTSKISALKTATHSLLSTLQSVSANPGDVMVSITPFAKLVNVGLTNPNTGPPPTSRLPDTWIDWTDWEAEPVDKNGNADAPGFSDGPGKSCPWTKSSDGFVCVKQPASTSTTSTIPSTGTYSGYICPGVMQTSNASTGSGGHYFNGCYTSTAATNTSTSNSSNTTSSQVCSKTGSNSTTTCTCSGYPKTTNTTSGNSTTQTNSSCSCNTTGRNNNQKTVCTASNVANTTTTTTTNGWTHAWVHNNHSTWAGCIEDRAQSYDVQNTSPGTGNTLFPAANDDNCPATTVMGLSDTWTGTGSLSSEVDAMSANGSTNQTIGLAHGWQTLTDGSPYSAGTLPSGTSQYIILLSDGLNTQNRWAGDGSNQSTPVDNRMAAACTNAKAAHITIYTIFVDLGGTQGNSTVLQNCATDLSHYFDLTTSGSIITTFNNIAQKITSLRVSQ